MPKKMKKRPRRITKILIAISLIIVALLLIFKAYIRYQPQNSTVQIVDDNSIPILKEYDSKTQGRNLWFYDKKFTQSKQLTFKHEVSWLGRISPDHKKILIGSIDIASRNNNQYSEFNSVFDIATKKITKLFPSYTKFLSVASVDWLDNNRVIYSIGRQIKIFTISSAHEETIIDTQISVTDATRILFYISPDKKWLVYYYSGNGEGDLPQQDRNYYSINLENKKQTRLTSSSGGIVAVNNNFAVYTQNSGIWKMDFSGSKRELITTVTNGDSLDVSSDDSGSKIVYQIRESGMNSSSANLYLYDLNTKTNRLLFKVDVADGIRDPRISSQGDSILFSAALDKINPLKYTVMRIDLQANTQATLNNDSESESSTVILY